ncbi:MAG: hypothetical protein QXM31_01625 [Candidatus Woesearchaeota archaeon]
MNKLFLALVVLSVIFVIGCQPAAPPAAPAPAAPAAPAPSAPAAPAPSGPAAPAETAPAEVAQVAARAEMAGLPLDKRCFDLLTAEDFKALCGYEGKVVLTPKITQGDCWVNIADPMNNKLTAGFTVVEWDKAEEANSEFDRGVKARVRQGAVEGKLVGERSYEYDEIARHNVVWVRGSWLTRLGSMTGLCPAEKLVAVAQQIDSGLQ